MRTEEGDFDRNIVGDAPLEPTTIDLWAALIAPGDVFRHPREVLTHPQLSNWEKRTILASWASDIHAVESCPVLRSLPGSKAKTVPVKILLDALAELDAGQRTVDPVCWPVKSRVLRRSRPRAGIRRLFSPRKQDGDDDPPPCPAGAMPRPRPPTLVDAVGVRVPSAA